MFSEPLAGWRHVEVTERRTKKDYAHQLKSLVDIYHPEQNRANASYPSKTLRR